MTRLSNKGSGRRRLMLGALLTALLPTKWLRTGAQQATNNTPPPISGDGSLPTGNRRPPRWIGHM
ncbi:MAG: hypothetical protein IPL79_04755 [Myxococcales bacterium]|nr:hypothetical protein [Myxococcales bacterium]